MKNSPYLDKPLRSEREVKMETLLRQMIAEWPQAFTEPDEDQYINGSDAVDALISYLLEAKEILTWPPKPR